MPTRFKLLIVGIVAQKMASKATCTAYSVAHDYGISHVTARKELATLEACGILEKKDCLSENGFRRVQYKVSADGFDFLLNNLELYTEMYIAFLFSEQP